MSAATSYTSATLSLSILEESVDLPRLREDEEDILSI